MAELFQNNKPAPGDYFQQKQMEVLIDISTKKVLQEIASLKGMVGQLSQELSELRSRRQDVPVETQHQSAPAAPTPIHQPAAAAPASRSSDQPRPRFGDVKPEDVAIDKFFYFGNKR